MDTPARIAILGAGPIGIEAALYARFLGYQVDVLERGDVAAHVRRWGHVRMFSPFQLNSSPLGLNALNAQRPDFQAPAADALLTGGEWVDQYLQPLTETDLLADCIHTGLEVRAVGRREWIKTDSPGAAERGDDQFRTLTQRCGAGGEPVCGGEREWTSDIVIDTTGVYGNSTSIGRGGAPAIGEAEADIHYQLPDVLGSDRSQFAGQHTVVVGGGYSAATTVVALAELARQESNTTVSWLTRRTADAAGPLAAISHDALIERANLIAAANRLALSTSSVVDHLAGVYVDRIERAGENQIVHISGDVGEPRQLTCDRIVCHTGFRGDHRLFETLQVHQCYATDGPIKLAAALLGMESEDCLAQPDTAANLLLNPEPNFYLLGSKSYGRNSKFLFANGLEQIRQLFSIIGDRESLDLYAGATRVH
ncbi:MAG: hypothetical protein QGG36_09810 [Pirellulaceae bacterium]|nr:hypothetical protein [Pirellulaceae bacterium]